MMKGLLLSWLLATAGGVSVDDASLPIARESRVGSCVERACLESGQQELLLHKLEEVQKELQATQADLERLWGAFEQQADGQTERWEDINSCFGLFFTLRDYSAKSRNFGDPDKNILATTFHKVHEICMDMITKGRGVK